jgi:hypothetical protein
MKRSLFLAAILAATGCGGVKTGTVSGTAMHQGKPLAGWTITFVSKEHYELPVSAMIEQDGSYKVENVPYGELCIGIAPPNTLDETSRKAKEDSANPGAAPPPKPATKPALPKVDPKLADPLNSGLTVTLDAPAVSHTIDLK